MNKNLTDAVDIDMAEVADELDMEFDAWVEAMLS